MNEENPEPQKRIRWYVLAANALFIVLIIVAIFGFKEEKSVIELARGIDPWWLVAAVILQIGTYLCTGGAWKVILRQFTDRISLGEIAVLAIEKLSFDQLFPTLGVGGSFAVIRSLERRGVAGAEALAVMMTDALCFYGAYLALFGLAALLLFSEGGFDNLARTLVLAFFGLLCALIGLIVFLVWRLRAKGTIGWFARFSFARERAKQIEALPPGTFVPNRSWAIALLLEASVFLLDAATLWAMFAALGHPLTPGQALIALMFSSAAAALSAIPGGLGFFESAGILVVNRFGIPLSAAIAGVLLLRGFTYWLPLVPGYFILRRELTAPAAEMLQVET